MAYSTALDGRRRTEEQTPPSSVHGLPSSVAKQTMHNIPPTELIAQARAALTGRRYPPELLAQLDLLGEPALHASPWVALFQGRRLCRLHSRFAEATAADRRRAGRVPRAGRPARASCGRWPSGWSCATTPPISRPGWRASKRCIERPMRPYLRAELLFGRFLCLIGLSRVREAVQAGEAALDRARRRPPTRGSSASAASRCCAISPPAITTSARCAARWLPPSARPRWRRSTPIPPICAPGASTSWGWPTGARAGWPRPPRRSTRPGGWPKPGSIASCGAGRWRPRATCCATRIGWTRRWRPTSWPTAGARTRRGRPSSSCARAGWPRRAGAARRT